MKYRLYIYKEPTVRLLVRKSSGSVRRLINKAVIGGKKMLKAKEKNSNKIIYAWDVGIRQEYSCPICNNDVLFVNAQLKIKHFRHRIEPTDFLHESESIEHDTMKKFIRDLLITKYPDTDIEVVNGEHRADVWTEIGKLVIECQCSPIDISDFNSRTKYWESKGFRVIWIWSHTGYDSDDRVILNAIQKRLNEEMGGIGLIKDNRLILMRYKNCYAERKYYDTPYMKMLDNRFFAHTFREIQL
jgi:hypothetical protein